MNVAPIIAWLCGRSKATEAYHIKRLAAQQHELEKKAQFFLLHQDPVSLAQVQGKHIKVTRELNARRNRYAMAWGVMQRSFSGRGRDE